MSENKPPPRKVKVVITMRKECRDRLKKLAEASFRNVSQELELIIDLFLRIRMPETVTLTYPIRMHKDVRKCSKLSKDVQTCLNMSSLVNIRQKMSKHNTFLQLTVTD